MCPFRPSISNGPAANTRAHSRGIHIECVSGIPINGGPLNTHPCKTATARNRYEPHIGAHMGTLIRIHTHTKLSYMHNQRTAIALPMMVMIIMAPELVPSAEWNGQSCTVCPATPGRPNQFGQTYVRGNHTTRVRVCTRINSSHTHTHEHNAQICTQGPHRTTAILST